MPRLRVGVVFGGRSGEHEVSLASAASVIAALEERGHTVVPIGIARNGRWVVGGDPMRALATEARVALPSNDADGAVKKVAGDSVAGNIQKQSDSGTALKSPESAAAPPSMRPIRLEIHANEDAWLSVIADGKTMMEGVLPAASTRK